MSITTILLILTISINLLLLSGCTTPPSDYTVGGFVCGLKGTLILQNNGKDDITITSDGPFVFDTPLKNGENYNVTIKSQPTGQTGYVTNGKGIIEESNVNNIMVKCYNSGTLDPTFGNNGIITYDGTKGDDRGYSIITDPNGKIIVTGSYYNGNDTDIIVIRLNNDGSLDTTFNNNGIKIYDAGGNEVGRAITLDSHGRILITGTSRTGTNYNVITIRLNANGSFDNTFGVNGVVTFDNKGNDDHGYSIITDSKDRVLIAGKTVSVNDTDVLVLRYNENGSLDTTFDGDGIATYDSTLDTAVGESMTIDSQGRILITGNTADTNVSNLIILRYNENGSLDNTFGSGGVVTYDNGDNEYGFSITTDSQGRILVTGDSESTTADLIVLRYKEDGTLDNSFGNGGLVTYNGGTVTAGFCIKTDSQDWAIVAGVVSSDGNIFNIIIVKFESDGNIDTNFGLSGVATYYIENNYHDKEYSISIDSLGKILFAGTDNNGSDNDILILRYIQ